MKNFHFNQAWICKSFIWNFQIFNNMLFINKLYMIPTDPAVKPTTKKNMNSSKSLGNEFTIRLI